MNPAVMPMANPNPSTKNTYDCIGDTRCRIYWSTRISPSMAASWPRTILGMWAIWSSELWAIFIWRNKIRFSVLRESRCGK